MRRCTECQLEKPIDSFYPKVRKSGKIGRSSKCKPCQIALRAEYYTKNPDKKVLTNRKSQLSKYGITPSDFDVLYAAQEGRCAGCKRHQVELNRRISVDHSHSTGIVRGLLCQPCNTILGLANDNPEILQNLTGYLLKTPELAGNQSNVVEGNFTKKVG